MLDAGCPFKDEGAREGTQKVTVSPPSAVSHSQMRHQAKITFSKIKRKGLEELSLLREPPFPKLGC